MQVVIRQMVLELKRIDQKSGRVAKEAKRVSELGRRAALLLSGRRLKTFARSWSAYQQFELHALVESATDLYSISVPESTRNGQHYLDNRDPRRPCEPLPEHVKTALALASWLRTKKYMARSGTPPHRSLAELLRAINDVARQEVERMREALEQMREGTYDAWKPPAIIGVPSTVRRTSIEGAFLSRAPHLRSVPLPKAAWPKSMRSQPGN
jgi:hypothetical protein